MWSERIRADGITLPIHLGVANHLSSCPDSLIRQVHIFPFGGIVAAAYWAGNHKAEAARASTRSA